MNFIAPSHHRTIAIAPSHRHLIRFPSWHSVTLSAAPPGREVEGPPKGWTGACLPTLGGFLATHFTRSE